MITCHNYPLPTRILFGISDFIGTHGIGLLAVLIILVLLFLLLFRIPAVRRKRDEWKLKIPVARKASVRDLYGEICKIVKLIVPFGTSNRECHADCKKDDWKQLYRGAV